MIDVDQNVVWVLVGVIVVQGVWMAGLTYLMWKRHREKKEREEDTTKST